MNKIGLWSVSILVALLVFSLAKNGLILFRSPTSLPPVITKTDKSIESSETTKQTVLKYSSDETTFFTQYSERNADGSIKYVFSTPDKKSDSMITIYETTEYSNVQFSLPGNSWSPDNKQFFITKNTPEGDTHLVFKADGTGFKDGSHYYHVNDLWTNTKHTSKITSATGWGGNDLLILKTQLIDGTNGPDFWFVTSTKGFQQLRQL